MSDPNTFDFQEVRKILKKRSTATQIQRECHRSSLPSKAEQEREDHESMEQPIVGYRVLDKMGSGGTSVVFKAESIASGEIVALKLLYPNLMQDKRILKQFINEGMMLMKLNHPNILKGIDFGISKGMYFLALECVQGESLDLFLHQGLRFTEKYTFEVAFQIAQALAYLEKKQIVHRDVKPANILLMENNTIKLCDFAFAIETAGAAEGSRGVTCGTVEYISPEQARGKEDMDIRSDIYSLGITCIHMLSGKVPFTDKDPQEVMRCQIYEMIDLNKVVHISQSGRFILNRMIAKNREDRFLPSRLVPMLEKFLKNYDIKGPL